MQSTILHFIQDNIHIVGWSAIISGVFYAWRKSISVSIAFTKNHEQGQKAMEQINLMSVNHLPHMEAGIAELNTKADKSNEILAECSKSLAVLVDRGNRQ